MVMKKKGVVRYVLEVQEAGFPKGFLETRKNGKRMVRTFRTRTTAERGRKALMKKLEGEFVSLTGRVKRFKSKKRTVKIRKVWNVVFKS